MVKSSAMKVYGNAFGIQHVHNIIFELHVWQLIGFFFFFLGAKVLSSTWVTHEYLTAAICKAAIL